MSIKKIKNYFDPRENLILSQRDEDEEKLSFEEARNLGAQRMRAEKSASANTDAPASRPKLSQPTGRNAGMGLMTELQKNNLSFDAARQIGVQNHALDYQREIRERALKMREELKNQKSPYEELSKEDKGSLARLYSLQNQLKTFSTYNQTNPQGGNPIMQAQNPYNTDIQQEYNNLYSDLNKKGYDVTELMRYYERIKNEEAAEDIQKKLTKKTADHPALMSAASVGLNLLTAQNSFPKAMKDAIYDAAYGTNLGVDTNAPEFFGTYSTNAVREKASGDIVEKTREKYGDGAAWAANLLYGTGMSMADSLTANALGGFTPIGGVIQGINAANSTLIDANERGVSAGKTLLTAAAAGVFEGFFEDVSLSKLKAMQPEMNSTLKAVGKNILKQMGVEGSEESATEIANIIFDSALNGDKSSMALKRAAYVKQGMSPAEATGQVIWDAVRQVAEAGIGGALSGVGFGAGGALTNYAAYNGQVKQIGSEALQSGQYDARLRNALQFDPSSDIGQAAIKMVNKDKVRSKDAGRFTVQYDKAASDAIQNASNEQEVQEAYHKFSSEEDTSGTIALAKMADERIRALALQKVDAERAQEQQDNETSEAATQSTAIEGQAVPRVAASAHETQTRSESNRTAGEYFKRDGTAWRRGVSQNNKIEVEPRTDMETRYATTHLARLVGTGEEVKVMDVASTDGGMAVRLSDGRSAKLNDLQFDKNEEQMLYSMAKQFPTAKARAFVNNYDGSIGIENYTRAFNVLYEAGYQGKTNLVKAMQKVAGIPRERKAMLSFLYLAGENRAAAKAKAKQERQSVARGSGRFANKTGEKLDEAMQLLYMGTAAKTGMTIELKKQIQKDANGAFDTGLSRVLLSQSADNQIATLVHETAEYVREYNPERMLDVQEAMLGWYAKVCNFETLAAMVEDYRQRYEGKLGKESTGEAMGEMTNDAMSALFADKAGVQDFLNWLKEDSGKSTAQQKNILQTIVDLFERLIERITAYFGKHGLMKEADVFAQGMDIDQMKALRQMFFEAANQARENYDAATQKTADGFAEVESAGHEKATVKTENGEEMEAEQIRNFTQDKIHHREEQEPPESIYYTINEEDARRAKQMNSFGEYQQGSATAEYQTYVDKALEIAEQQKQRVDPIYHEKIDSILDTYARKLAANMNNRFAIEARVPSILVAGGGNFPVQKKEKQNAARDRNMEEWQDIQGLLEKIRSTGMGGISTDDPQAVAKLEAKLENLVKSQEIMKAVNAYYRKNGTLDGCTLMPPDQIRKLQSDMAQPWHLDKSKPFQSFALSNNNADIRRTRERIATLKRHEQQNYAGWEFDGGRVEANKESNRLQIFFDNKPDEATRAEMKANGFRWAPSASAWQRQLSANAYRAADHISYIQPNTGEKPTALLRQAQQQVEPTGAETLTAEKEGSKDVKYMFAGEKATTANPAALERAKREKENESQSSEMIRRSTGWHQGPDGKWRFEIDDSQARFGDESSNRLEDFLLHEELYEAYPELREIRVEKLGENEPKRLRGRYIADEKKIQYDPNLTPKDRMTTLLHEIQHIIQRTEGFGKGGSRDATEVYLFNRAYDYAKTLPSYQSMQTPEQREQFVKDLIAARSRSGDYETALTEAYQNLFGEIEARNTANRQPLDQQGRKIASPTNPKESIVVTDWLEEAIRYKRNRAEIHDTVALAGEERYNQGKGGEMHDEETGVRDHARGNVSRGQRGAIPSVSSEKSKIKPHVRSDPSIRRIGTEPGGREEGVYGRQRSVSGIAGLSPKRTSPELKKIEKGSSEYNDTPERTKYSLKRSMGGAGLYMDDLSYRRYPSNNPMSDWGHAMFSDDPYHIEQYGNRLFGVFLTDLVDVEDLKPQIAEAWEKSLASPFSMIHHDSYWEQFSGTEIAENFDPVDIVDSAEAWDNPELVQWFFEECDFWEGFRGLKTRDGAIVWDQDIIHEGDPDPDNGVIGEDIVNKITKYSFREPIENTPEYAELLSKWGSIKPGYKPFREIKVPKKTSDGKKVRRFVRSVMESNAVTDEMAEDLKEEIVKGAVSYTVISDKAAQDVAKKILDEDGVKGAWKHWNSVVNGDKFPEKKDIALGEYLLRLAAENGDKSEVMRLIAEISEIGTRMGQSVQALSMLKKMGGAGQLVYVQRTVDTLNKDLIKRFKGKAFAKVTFNKKLAENLVNAKTPKEVETATQELYRDIADQLPPTWIDKWNAWRYLSMLGNAKTHIRNILGNAVFAPVVRLKDAVGAGIEAMTVHDGERTKAVGVKQEYRDFAKQDFSKMQDIIKSGGKMNPADAIRDQRTIFKNKTLEQFRKKNFELMELEDGWFLKSHYESHLAQYLQANKIDLSEISEEQLSKARIYAVEQAQKATFRDASPMASAIQRASNTNPYMNVLVEGVLPYKKTPINVLKRGAEYSPAGLLYTLSRGSAQLKRGEITVSQYIDGLAAGLTGTGLTALGAMLCGLGWVSGGFGDDKEDELEKLQGRQEYALQIGGFTYTIDWMAPAAIPFFIGVELMAALKGEYEDIPSRAIIDALANIAEPMFNLSMLDGLNDTINAVSFSDNKLTAMVQEVLTSYFLQAIPAVSGQTARSVDPTRRRTYIDKNSWIPESMQRAYQKLFNKIPFLSYLNQPYIDEWGREDKTQNIAVRAFENFLSPGWFSEVKTSDMEQELKRLYEATGESGVLPGYAAKHITVDGEKINLTGDEYTIFATVRGQTAYSTIGEIIASEEYADMSDAQKVKAIKDAFEFAGSAAKAAVSEYELEGWKQDANEESQEEGVSIGEAIAHRAATNGAAPEIASILQDDGAEAAQEKIDRMMKACASRDEMKDQKGNVKSAITRAYKKKYIKYHDAGDVEGMRKIRQELMQLRTPVGKLYTMKDFRNWIEK